MLGFYRCSISAFVLFEGNGSETILSNALSTICEIRNLRIMQLFYFFYEIGVEYSYILFWMIG